VTVEVLRAAGALVLEVRDPVAVRVRGENGPRPGERRRQLPVRKRVVRVEVLRAPVVPREADTESERRGEAAAEADPDARSDRERVLLGRDQAPVVDQIAPELREEVDGPPGELDGAPEEERVVVGRLAVIRDGRVVQRMERPPLRDSGTL